MVASALRSFYEHLPLVQARMLTQQLTFHFTATADRP